MMIFLYLLQCGEVQSLIWNTQAPCEPPCIRTYDRKKIEIRNNHGMSYFINEIDSYLRFTPTDFSELSSGMQYLSLHQNNGSEYWNINASFITRSMQFPFMFWDYELKTMGIDLRRFRVQVAEVPDFGSWRFWLGQFRKPIFKLI